MKEARRLEGTQLEPGTFRPFTEHNINTFYYLFDGVLVKFLNKGELSAAQTKFVDQTVALTSRLIHHELLVYNLQLPNRANFQPPIVHSLPSNLKKIQNAARSLGLADAIREHYDEGRPDRPLLAEGEPWLDITAELATGEINLLNNPELRELLEDCASGLVRFIHRLGVENGGLVEDEYVVRQLSALENAYNRLHAEDSPTQQ